MNTNLVNVLWVTNQMARNNWLTESYMQTTAPFHGADYC